MSEAKEKRERVLQSVKLIAPFDGDRNYLALYIDSSDAIMPNFSSLTPEEQPFYFQCVISTLRGSALDIIRREQPTTWTTLRNLLIDEFADHTPITTLILLVDSIKFKGNVRQLCDEINSEVCKINDSIKLRVADIATQTFLSQELKNISLKTLKRELPNHLTALININMALDLKSAIKILKENDAYDEVARNNYKKQQSSSQQNKQHFNNNRPQNQYPYNFQQPYSLYPHYPEYNHNFSFPVPQQNPYSTQYNNNSIGFYPNQQQLSQQSTNIRGNNSNQSRIRRYGAPVPMEQDVENFRLQASGSYPKSY